MLQAWERNVLAGHAALQAFIQAMAVVQATGSAQAGHSATQLVAVKLLCQLVRWAQARLVQSLCIEACLSLAENAHTQKVSSYV